MSIIFSTLDHPKRLKLVSVLLVQMSYLVVMRHIKILTGALKKLTIHHHTLISKVISIIKIQKFLEHQLYYGKKHLRNIQNF